MLATCVRLDSTPSQSCLPCYDKLATCVRLDSTLPNHACPAATALLATCIRLDSPLSTFFSAYLHILHTHHLFCGATTYGTSRSPFLRLRSVIISHIFYYTFFTIFFTLNNMSINLQLSLWMIIHIQEFSWLFFLIYTGNTTYL